MTSIQNSRPLVGYEYGAAKRPQQRRGNAFSSEKNNQKTEGSNIWEDIECLN